METNREQRFQSILKRKPYLQIFTGPNHGDFSLETGPMQHVIPLKNGRALCSRKPDLEAERALPHDRARWTGKEIILIMGLGNPGYLSAILPFLKDNQICIAVDSRFELGQLLFQSGAILDFLERPGCHLFAGDAMIAFLQTYLESIPAVKFKGIRRMLHAPSQRDAEIFFREVQQLARNILKAKLSDLLTRFEFEKTWIEHIIINSKHLSKNNNTPASETILSWKDSLAGIPGVLVGAGPGLRKSIPILKELESKAMILTCDTALKVMTGHNAKTHGVISLDAQKHTLFHFLGEDLGSTVLFTDVVVNPIVLRYGGLNKVIFSTTARYSVTHDGQAIREATPGTEFAESIHGPIGDIQSGGSVATSGFELLRYMGCNPIFLVGLDMAYTGREIHSTGSHHNEKWLTKIKRTSSLEGINQAVIRKRQTRMVEATGGGEVLTDYVLDLYRTWFEDSIPKAGVRVINLSQGGAKIAGAETLENPLEEIYRMPDVSEKLNILKDAPALTHYNHETLQNMIRDLNTLNPNEFMDAYPFARTLLRKAEVYRSRNAQRLGQERSDAVYKRALTDAITRLKRGLRIV